MTAVSNFWSSFFSDSHFHPRLAIVARGRNRIDTALRCVCVSACCLQSATVILREAMSVEEFLASACSRKNLNPMEHFLRVKKRKDMEDHNYFVPHRTDLVETYVSTARDDFFTYTILFSAQSYFCQYCFFPSLFSPHWVIEVPPSRCVWRNFISQPHPQLSFVLCYIQTFGTKCI